MLEGWGLIFVRESALLSLLSLSQSRHNEEYTAAGIMTTESCPHMMDARTERTYFY